MLLQIGIQMLEIVSEKIEVNLNSSKCIEYLSDLNNYINLFPKDKIKNWESNKNFCTFSIQNTYVLDIKKVAISKNKIHLKSEKKSPFNFNIIIDIQDLKPETCTAQITSKADVSPMLKVIVGKPLNELFNYMANSIEKAILTE